MNWKKGRTNDYAYERALLDGNTYEIRCFNKQRKWRTYVNGEEVDLMHALNRNAAKAKVDMEYKRAVELNPRIDLRTLPKTPEQITNMIMAKTGKRRTKAALQINKDVICYRCKAKDNNGLVMRVVTTAGQMAERSLCGQCESELLIWFANVPQREWS